MKIALMALTVFMGGCTTTLETISMPWEKTPLDLDPAPVEELEDVEWVVVNKDNQEAVLAEHKTIIGLTEKGFKDLAVNVSRMLKNIRLNREVIDKYKDYYE